MLKVGITGGIGSGKTTLCKLFQGLSVPVYYSDVEAKQLMNSDEVIRKEIIAAFGDESYVDGQLNRTYLAKSVFGSDEKRIILNSIVHPRVMTHFNSWSDYQSASYVVLESAILFESGFDKCVDTTVGVLSPRDLRIERVMKRDDLSREEVESRMEAQMSDDELKSRVNHSVVSIFDEDLEGAVTLLDRKFRYDAESK